MAYNTDIKEQPTMTTQTAIAAYLNIATDLITEIQEWATVLWVRVKGIGCRFVSKKIVVKKMVGSEKQVTWAKEVQAKLLKTVAEYRQELFEDSESENNLKALCLLMCEQANEIITTQSDAKWFINHSHLASSDIYELGYELCPGLFAQIDALAQEV